MESVRTGSRRRTLLGRLSPGHLVMIVAGLLGLLLTAAALRRADARQEVAVAARDLHSGVVVEASDIRYERVRVDHELLDTMFRRADADKIRGAITTGPIAAGELISRNDVRRAAASHGLRAMSVPIDPARALNGDLDSGDRVDVVVAAEHEVAIIVAGAEVLAVHKPERSGAFGSLHDQFSITLAVDARQSQLLTAAIADGDVVITRATGARSAAQTPPLPAEFSRSTPKSSGG